jgi:hypothetical protein
MKKWWRELLASSLAVAAFAAISFSTLALMVVLAVVVGIIKIMSMIE